MRGLIIPLSPLKTIKVGIYYRLCVTPLSSRLRTTCTDPWSHYGARDREWDLGSAGPVARSSILFRVFREPQATSGKLQATSSLTFAG